MSHRVTQPLFAPVRMGDLVYASGPAGYTDYPALEPVAV
jgi:hypothetical protein